MPIDTRRLPVPADSKSPLVYVKKATIEETILVSKDGQRKDGRKPDQMRPIFLRHGVITKAKGSAYIEMNQTKVICAVYGPREVTRREDFSMKGQLQCHFQRATFSQTIRGQHQMDDSDREQARLILQALEPAVMLDKFPKARMDVFVTVIENAGSCIAAALTCASVALADAGVEMYDLVLGASMRQSGDLQLLDPTKEEEYIQYQSEGKKNEGEVVVGYMPSLNQIAALSQQGNMDLTTSGKAIKLCIESCQHLYPIVQQALIASIEQKEQKT